MYELGTEKVIIENELHNRISIMSEKRYDTLSERKEAEEKVFKDFYNELQTYKGCPKLKLMTLEEIKEIYYNFRDSLQKTRDDDEER